MDSNTSKQVESSSTPIESLPLADRLLLANNFQPFNGVEAGWFVDAKDTVNAWCVARVLEADGKTAKVSYDGWSARYDDTLKLKSTRVLPFRRASKGYTGQMRTPLRTTVYSEELLENHRRRVAKIVSSEFGCLGTAFEVTQYLRGDLYTFLDLAMTSKHEDKELQGIYDFMHLVAKLVALWLKIFPTALLKPFIEYQKYPNLMLVDRNCALAACGYELLDMLKWLFCACPRTGIFFGQYDIEPVASKFTKEFPKDKLPAKRDPHFDYDHLYDRLQADLEVAFGLQVNIFEQFCEHGGLQAIKEIISLDNIAKRAESVGQAGYKLPLVVVTMFISPLKGVKHIAKKEVREEIVEAGKDTFCRWIQLLEDKDIKELSKERLNKEVDQIKDFLLIVYSADETRRIMQDNEMQITLKFLQSESLEKRLNGIGEIKRLVERAEILLDGDSENFLLDWMLKNHVLEIVLHENTHSEVIKRASPIFAFLARKGVVTTGVLDTLWKCQQDKDENTVLAIYEAIKAMIGYLPSESLRFVYEKINRAFLGKFDDNLLTFMRDFTINILSSASMKAEHESSTSTIPDPIHDASTGALAVPNDEGLYFVPAFWELIQDEASTTQSQSLMALKYLREMLICKPCEDARPQFIYLCIDNLKRHRSVPQSLELVIYLFNMSNMKHNNNWIPAGQWAKQLLTAEGLFKAFMEDFENYEKLVADYCAKSGKVDDDSVVVGKQKHAYNLERRFYFLQYTLRSVAEGIELGDENIQRLCDLFINNAGSEYDTKKFLNWPSSKDELKGPSYLFTAKETQLIFTIICRFRPKLIHLGQSYYKCFANYFKLINLEPKSFEISEDKILVTNFDKLSGLDQLWDCVRYCQQEETLSQFTELLITLYTNLEPGHSREKRVEIMKSFVDRCFRTIMELDVGKEELAITNLVKLLAAMLDFEDGTKYETETTDLHKQTLSVTQRETDETKQIEAGFKATVGQVKKKIARVFKIPFGSFRMTIFNKTFEPSDYDAILRSFNCPESIYIHRDDSAADASKAYLAQTQSFINALFGLLFKENTTYVELVWSLLNNIPPSKELQMEIESMQFGAERGWSEVLDTKSVYRFLYSLQIIEEFVDSKLSEDRSEADKKWLEKFCRTGGLEHLFNSLIKLPIENLHNPLTRKCFSALIKILYTIHRSGLDLKDHINGYEASKAKMIQRILTLLNAFSRHSVEKGKETKSSKEVEAEGQVFAHGFYLIKSVDKAYFETLMGWGEFKEFLMNGLVLCSNNRIKKALKDEVVEIFKTLNEKEPRLYIELLQYMLCTMVNETLEREAVCNFFYDLLAELIKNLSHAIDGAINFQELAKNLVAFVKAHAIKENKSSDIDYLLSGLLNLLCALVGRFPIYRNFVANDCGMIDEIIEKCLFDFPDINTPAGGLNAIPPKCKSHLSRYAAFNLLFVLCRNSAGSIGKVVGRLMPMHVRAAWRTKKNSDWLVAAESNYKSETGYVGLKNLGATCYMNSLLQQLYMIPTFRNEILAAANPEESVNPDDNPLFQTQCLFSALCKSVKQYYNTKAFCNAFKDWEGNPINVLEQMDVDEFLNLFLDRLEGPLSRTAQRDAIKRHFKGEFANQIIGKDCPHTSTRTEPFLTLTLQVKGKKSLQQCLESFVEGEMLQGSNAYFCDKCDKKVTALKRSCIGRLPRHLICVLKRFDLNYDTMQRFKINDYCEFPMRINMEEYTEEGLAKKDREKAKKESDEVEDTSKKLHPKEYYEYKLTGVVIHIGTSEVGHYYSLIMDREYPNVPEGQRWYEFNDTEVSKYNLQELSNDAFGSKEKFAFLRQYSKLSNAYLLFYERESSYEPPEGDEEEGDKAVTKFAAGETVIPKEINKEIQEENMKYWHNKYVFQKNYFEFVFNLGMVWNPESIVAEEFPMRNLDLHLLKLKPEETRALQKPEIDHSILNIEQEKPLSTMVSAEVINETSLLMAKYVLTVFLTTLIHCENKGMVPNFVEISKAYLNKHPELSRWLLKQFSNAEILKEFLIDIPIKDMTKFVVGLLYCAMLRLYSSEKSAIAKRDVQNSSILNFVHGWFHSIPSSSNMKGSREGFFQVIARAAFLGPEIRHTLIKEGCLDTLLSLIELQPKSFGRPGSEELKLPWTENKEVEIGFAQAADEKPSAFKSLVSSFKGKTADDERFYNFLLEAISLLLRSTEVNKKTKESPFALEGCDQTLNSDIKAFLLSEITIHQLIASSRNHLALISIVQALVHLSWENLDMKTSVASGVLMGLPHMEADNSYTYFYILRTLLNCQDSPQPVAVDYFLKNYLDLIRKFELSYRIYPFFRLLLGLAESVDAVEKWCRQNVDEWDWIAKWLAKYQKDTHTASSSFYTRLERQDTVYSVLARLAKNFNRLANNEPLDDFESFPQVATTYFIKFGKSDEVECYSWKSRCWERCAVDWALDEMVLLRPKGLDKRRSEQLDWTDVTSDYLAKAGTYTAEEESEPSGPNSFDQEI